MAKATLFGQLHFWLPGYFQNLWKASAVCPGLASPWNLECAECTACTAHECTWHLGKVVILVQAARDFLDRNFAGASDSNLLNYLSKLGKYSMIPYDSIWYPLISHVVPWFRQVFAEKRRVDELCRRKTDDSEDTIDTINTMTDCLTKQGSRAWLSLVHQDCPFWQHATKPKWFECWSQGGNFHRFWLLIFATWACKCKFAGLLRRIFGGFPLRSLFWKYSFFQWLSAAGMSQRCSLRRVISQMQKPAENSARRCTAACLSFIWQGSASQAPSVFLPIFENAKIISRRWNIDFEHQCCSLLRLNKIECIKHPLILPFPKEFLIGSASFPWVGKAALNQTRNHPELQTATIWLVVFVSFQVIWHDFVDMIFALLDIVMSWYSKVMSGAAEKDFDLGWARAFFVATCNNEHHRHSIGYTVTSIYHIVSLKYCNYYIIDYCKSMGSKQNTFLDEKKTILCDFHNHSAHLARPWNAFDLQVCEWTSTALDISWMLVGQEALYALGVRHPGSLDDVQWFNALVDFLSAFVVYFSSPKILVETHVHLLEGTPVPKFVFTSSLAVFGETYVEAGTPVGYVLTCLAAVFLMLTFDSACRSPGTCGYMDFHVS